MHSFLTFWHQAGKFDTCTAPHLVHVTNIRYVPDLLVHIQNIFVKILKHICPWNILVSYLFHVTCIMPLQVALWGSIIFQFIFVQIQNIFIQILKIFVQILKNICQYWKQYLYHVTCIMPLQVALWGCINFFLFQLRLTYMHILYIHQFHSSSPSSLFTKIHFPRHQCSDTTTELFKTSQEGHNSRISVVKLLTNWRKKVSTNIKIVKIVENGNESP